MVQMAKLVGQRQIGASSFDTEALQLRDADGRVVPLRAQSAQVLKVLIGAEGQLVTKDAIMDRVWSDRFVTDDSLVKCISDIRKALGDDAELLVTVPKRGYSLDDKPVAEAFRQIDLRAARKGWQFSRIGVAILLVVLVAVALATTLRDRDADPNSITIAVLPFRNTDGDADQRYLSDGVAEDLITALSQISDLRVISRGTSFAYSPDNADIRNIAETLQADVILEGSIRRRGDDLRLTIALVDGTTGQNIWAKHYDGGHVDLLVFQTDVLEELVRTLSVRLSRAERKRLGVRGTSDIEAYDAYLKGRELENLFTRRTNREAESTLRQAIARDPEFALAHAHLALTLSFRVENIWVENTESTIAEAFALAERAIDLDPELPFSHFVLGRLFSRNFAHDLPDATEKAFAGFERAIELDPNYLDAYVFKANLHVFTGEAEKALPLVDTALERNPTPPYWHLFAAGMARYFVGDFEAAEPFLVAARDKNPTAPFPHRYLIATYGMLRQSDDAEWAAIEYEALGRNASVQAMVTEGSIVDDAYREKFAEGLRAAGLPEN
jgi:TolB-like protein/DNA-binding winged helix-turn-helix (wHTH) protein